MEKVLIAIAVTSAALAVTGIGLGAIALAFMQFQVIVPTTWLIFFALNYFGCVAAVTGFRMLAGTYL